MDPDSPLLPLLGRRGIGSSKEVVRERIGLPGGSIKQSSSSCVAQASVRVVLVGGGGSGGLATRSGTELVVIIRGVVRPVIRIGAGRGRGGDARGRDSSRGGGAGWE